MKLVVSVGSYERILYGIDINIEKNETITVQESFAIPAHTGYIKTVASCPRFLVSGATDETIRIFDLKKRKDIGSLSQHQGTINALTFAGTAHLLSGGEDGRIGLFRTKDWECLHVLRHKKPITSITVHPSGKLAISVGKSRSLKLWNLMTGKQAHSSSTEYEPLLIQFSSNGKYYAIMSDFNVTLHETESSKKLFDFKSKSRLTTMAILNDEKVYIAGEGTLIQVIDMNIKGKGSTSDSDNIVVSAWDTLQSPRIRGMAIVPTSNGDILITASSSGSIKGWSIPDHKIIFEHDSKIRILCLSATIQ